MAIQTFTLNVGLRGGVQPFVQQFPFGPNSWQHIQLQINSVDWNTIDGLSLGYTARVSINGGASWIPWGGFTAVSPTFKRDNITKVEPGGIWQWDPTFSGGGLLEITVTCPTPFSWGATATLLDI